MSLAFMVFFGLVILAEMVYTLLTYNKLRRLTNEISEAWSNVSVALQRRHELIPRLVDGARLAAAYESAMQQSIACVRSGKIADAVLAESAIQKQLIADIESNPTLRAQKTFQQLYDALVQVEDDIQANRLIYNRAVATYRRFCKSFPARLVVFGLGFSLVGFMELDAALPSVSFGPKKPAAPLQTTPQAS